MAQGTMFNSSFNSMINQNGKQYEEEYVYN